MEDKKDVTLVLTVTMSSELHKKLLNLALRSGTTIFGLFGRAMNLLMVCQENVLSGGKIIVRSKDGTDREIVFLQNSPKDKN